jgi:tetratricopeptide (TPR) repeat protein
MEYTLPRATNTNGPKSRHSIHLGNYTGAIEYFDRALAVEPNDKDALYYKGESVAFDCGIIGLHY